MAGLADVVLGLEPDCLPAAPWVLERSETQPIGRSYFFGGPYKVVTDNVLWLAALQREVRQGPRGPRAKTGALQRDLKALMRAIVLGAESKREERA